MRVSKIARRRSPARRLGSFVLGATVLVFAAGVARASDGTGSGDSLLRVASPAGPVVYTPGRGLRVGESGLTVGGYGSVRLERLESESARLGFDALSFLVVWDLLPRLHLFAELEFEDLVSVDGDGYGGTGRRRFEPERLYADLAVRDWINVRVGKFLTPVGRWNVIHAEPLVWTTSRPLATSLPFDESTTGVMLFGSTNDAPIRYSLFGQFVDSFEPTPQPHVQERSGGARFDYEPSTSLATGATYLAFREAGRWIHLGGVDAEWRHGPVELLGELTVDDSGGAEEQLALYVQGALEVWPGFSVVGRYELLAPSDDGPDIHLVDLGIAYRPVPYIVLKADYLLANDDRAPSEPGFRSAVAFLF